MADYYTHYSFTLPLNKEQKEYARCKYEKALDDKDTYNELFDDDNECPGFDFGDDEIGIWFSNEGWEDGNIDNIANFIHHLIKALNLPPFGFEWANTCSNLCLESFGGGAVWITQEGFEWCSTNLWLEEKCLKQYTPPAPTSSASSPPPTEPEVCTLSEPALTLAGFYLPLKDMKEPQPSTPPT